MSNIQVIIPEILILFKPIPTDDFCQYIFATGQAKISDDFLFLARDFMMSLKGQEDEEFGKLTDITEDVQNQDESIVALETAEPAKEKVGTKDIKKKKKRSGLFKRTKKPLPEALDDEIIAEDLLEMSEDSVENRPKKRKPTASRRFKNLFVKHGPRAFVRAKNAVESKFQKMKNYF